jgi:hypothetical protein
MPPTRQKPPQSRGVQDRSVYVANTTFATEDSDGTPLVVRKGERARAGHDLVSRFPESWDRVEDSIMYEVEER